MQHSSWNSAKRRFGLSVITCCMLILLVRRSLSKLRAECNMLLNIRPPHLSGRTCELWWNGWLDLDAVWGGEWGRAWYGCIRFWWWSLNDNGQFGGEFAASHCNQWGLSCVVVWKCVQRSSCRLAWWVEWAQAFIVEVHVSQGEGAVSGMVSGNFWHFQPIVFNREMRYWSLINSCVKSWQYFPTQISSLNSVSNWLSYDIVRLKVEVGIDAKCMYKYVILNTRKIPAAAAAMLSRHITMT